MLLWIFCSWIVRGDDGFVAHGRSDVGHHWSFGFITVATATHYRNKLFVFGADIVDGFQDIF
jgi:hypothetical protein